jgi:hypothetical protein
MDGYQLPEGQSPSAHQAAKPGSREWDSSTEDISPAWPAAINYKSALH